MATFRERKIEEDKPAIINIPETGDILDRGTNSKSLGEKSDIIDDYSPLVKSMKEQVTSLVWQQGRQQAQKAFNLYANIDILRPYFHVELSEVRQRLLDSLIPQFSPLDKPVLPGELYGPLMLVFTLIAILLYGMKVSDHTVKEGTLMGTAFGVCFGYWLGGASFIYFLCYVCNTHISYLQTLSLLGYALFGHCVALLLGIVFHPESSHTFFYIVWVIFGGLSTMKLIFVIMTRTSAPPQRLVVCSAAACLHLLFLIYLHFAYHKTVEAIDKID